MPLDAVNAAAQPAARETRATLRRSRRLAVFLLLIAPLAPALDRSSAPGPLAARAETSPAAPGAVMAFPLSSTGIELRWNDRADNESHYRIDRREGWSGEWITLVEALPADSTSHADTGLEPSADFFYRVFAINDAGSEVSGLARAITDDAPFGLRTLVFQDGVNAYEGAQDVGIAQLDPAASNTSTYVWVDNNSATDESQALLDFTGIIGGEPFQVPSGAAVTQATLRIYLGTVSNAGSNREIPFSRMLVPWDESSSWNSPTWGGNGVDLDSRDALSFPDAVKVFTNPGTFHDVKVTPSLLAWVAGQPRHGWLISAPNSDGYAYYTTHNAVVEQRPALFVTFDTDPANRAPTVAAWHGPAPGDETLQESVSLDFTVADANGDALAVTLLGRQLPLAQRDFTVVVLPDTQFYAARMNGGSPAIFNSQTNWVVQHREDLNIAFVLHMGDITQNGDMTSSGSSNRIEWIYASQAMYRLEDPVTTKLPQGIPYGVAVGNHDQEPIWDPEGTTQFYNEYFGVEHFAGKHYYGGHHGSNNDNYFQLYSIGGLRFLSISLEYRGTADPDVLEWADQLLKAYPDRYGILTTHHLVGAGDPAQWSPYGAVIYETLKDNPNLGLMLGGHIHGEGRRTDTYNGHTVHSILQDYQGYANGGNGYLRVYTFSPQRNEIRVETYSPWLERYEIDESSTFTLDYDMGAPPAPFVELAHFSVVAPDRRIAFDWTGLEDGAEFEWYAVLSDGRKTTVTETRSFATVHPYSEWIQGYYPDATPDRERLRDPDADGRSNVFEFLFDTDPTDGSFDPHMPTAVVGPGTTEIRYRRRLNPRLVWDYEVSTDLLNWGPPPPGVVTLTESIEPDAGDRERVTVVIENSAEAVFWRIAVR